MINIIALRKALKILLNTDHARVYFQEPNTDATFPYLIYDLPNSYDLGDSEVFTLDVDGWDNPADKDSTALETLMDAMDAVVNKHAEVLEWDGGKAGIAIFREARLTLQEDDKRILRRKYTYQVQVV